MYSLAYHHTSANRVAFTRSVLAAASVTLMTLAQSAAAQSLGYAWNSSPSASGTYTPTAAYAFDSRKIGGTTITHNSTGSYTVHFAKLGNGLNSNVEVGAYGSSQAVCASNGWSSPNTIDVDVGVLCHDLANNAADSYFTVLYQERTVWHGKGTFGFIWADQPSNTATYTPNTTYSFNSRGGANTVTREGAGNYVVEMAGIAGAPNGNLNPYVGSALVTGYATNALCRSIVLGHNATTEAITINCWDLVAQQPIDSYFDLAYSYNLPIDAGNPAIKGAYLRDTKPTATFAFAPPPPFQFNGFVTGALQVQRTGTGTYQVSIPGSPAYVTSMAMANLGQSTDYVPQNGSFCNVLNWSSASSTIEVGCYGPAGAPEDAIFDLTYLTTATP